ncbi:MAG: hypothetical protein ABTD50_22915 [Polyangiaceae bacterium]|jgi:hypothetical protein
MSRATPLLLLFVASEVACSGAAIARPDDASPAGGCCTVALVTSQSGTGEVEAANVHDCSASPPDTACLPYAGEPGVYLCAAQVGPGAFVPSADGGIQFCF